jgi:Schlafen, AlbA_2
MDKSSLVDLVKKGEGQFLEFKEKSSNAEKILNELVAFANTDGGRLLVGVTDSARIVGIKESEGEMEYLISLMETKIYPGIPYKTCLVPIDKERSVVVIEVKEGPKKPYGITQTGQKWTRAYKRQNDESLLLGPVEKRVLALGGIRKKGILRYFKNEQVILKSIPIEGVGLKQLSQKTGFDKGYLIRKLALFNSRGLISIKKQGETEHFQLIQ